MSSPLAMRIRFSFLIVLSLLVLTSCEASGEYEMKTFNLGNGRSIAILASEHLEVTQSFYYQVMVERKIVVPLMMVCVGIDRGQLKFNTLTAKNGDLIGIFEEHGPQEILAIHDFEANTTWPGTIADGGPERYQQHGARLLEELQSEHPGLILKLGPHNACGG